MKVFGTVALAIIGFLIIAGICIAGISSISKSTFSPSEKVLISIGLFLLYEIGRHLRDLSQKADDRNLFLRAISISSELRRLHPEDGRTASEVLSESVKDERRRKNWEAAIGAGLPIFILILAMIAAQS